MTNAANFLGEIKVTYERKESPPPAWTSSADSVKFFRSIIGSDWIEHHEEMWAAYLNKANKLVGFHQLSKGSIDGTVCDIRILLQAALGCNASGVILMHNHPSGNLKPSQIDITLTNKAKNACALLDIKLLDHLILTYESSYSFADEGLLNTN